MKIYKLKGFYDTQLQHCLPERMMMSSCSAVDGKVFLEHEASRMYDIAIKVRCRDRLETSLPTPQVMAPPTTAAGRGLRGGEVQLQTVVWSAVTPTAGVVARKSTLSVTYGLGLEPSDPIQ